MKGTMIIKFKDGRGQLCSIHNISEYKKVMRDMRPDMPNIECYRFVKTSIEVNPENGSMRFLVAPDTYLIKGGK